MLRSNCAALGGLLILLACGCTTRTAVREPVASGATATTPTTTITSGQVAPTVAAPVAPTKTLAAFDRAKAAKLMATSAERAKSCQTPDGPTGKGRAHLVFAADGVVQSIELDAPYKDTDVGRCVIRELQAVSVDAFAGEPVKVAKTFEIKQIELDEMPQMPLPLATPGGLPPAD